MVNVNTFVMIADRSCLFGLAMFILLSILANIGKQPNYDYSTFGYYVLLDYMCTKVCNSVRVGVAGKEEKWLR